MHIIDITQELLTCAVYPGDIVPRLKQVRQMPPDDYNLTIISICTHNGTHVDAPRHFVQDGLTVDKLDLQLFYGPCTVAKLEGAVGRKELAPVLAGCQPRLLLKGEITISEEAAAALAASHVSLLGVEDQSVGPVEAPMAVHRILLEAGMAVLEGLRLGEAAPGEYQLCAFPLKLGGCEGAPVRAVLVAG